MLNLDCNRLHSALADNRKPTFHKRDLQTQKNKVKPSLSHKLQPRYRPKSGGFEENAASPFLFSASTGGTEKPRLHTGS